MVSPMHNKQGVCMANLIDYIKWRGDLSFSAAPFCTPDAMIMCQLSYYNLDGIVPKDFGESTQKPVCIKDIKPEDVLEPLPNYCSGDDLKMLELLAKSPRFADMQLAGFVNDVDEAEGKQFSAVTVRIDKNTHFIAFRGTDDTLVGWKENMDLAYHDEVPSHAAAIKYIEFVSKNTKKDLIVGGHSKGGNLAVYGSAFCDRRRQKRIKAVYNFDGPGFNDKVIEKENFKTIEPIVHTYVPQNSIIGILLDHKEKYNVIKSSKTIGMSEHIMFTWEVERDRLIEEKELAFLGEAGYASLNEWIDRMTFEEKEKFIEVLYGMVSEYKTTDNLFSVKNIIPLVTAYRNLSDENKQAVGDAMGDLKNSITDYVMEKFSDTPVAKFFGSKKRTSPDKNSDKNK